jgi:dihydropteroate synthase
VLDHQVLSALLEKYRGALGKPVRTFALGGRLFDFNRYRYLVGVINLSTDSWYRESVCTTTLEAIARAEMLHSDGADIIDIGAESTLPHARQADIHQQLERLLPVVEALKARRLLVSVESYYPEVLETCAKAGADIFNLTGTLYGEDIFKLAATYDTAVILCYVQGPTVRQVGDFRFHDDMLRRRAVASRNVLSIRGLVSTITTSRTAACASTISSTPLSTAFACMSLAIPRSIFCRMPRRSF